MKGDHCAWAREGSGFRERAISAGLACAETYRVEVEDVDAPVWGGVQLQFGAERVREVGQGRHEERGPRHLRHREIVAQVAEESQGQAPARTVAADQDAAWGNLEGVDEVCVGGDAVDERERPRTEWRK